MFRLYASVVFTNHGHVGFDIACRCQQALQTPLFTTIVQESENDGNVRAVCDMVKTRFPVVRFLPGSFRGYDDDKGIALVQLFDGLSNHSPGLAPIDRDTSKIAHNRTVDSLEQALLPHPVNFDAVVKSENEHDGKIPIAGMRYGNQHVLFGDGRLAKRTPSDDAQNQTSHPMQKVAKYWRVKKRVIGNVSILLTQAERLVRAGIQNSLMAQTKTKG